ncbi:MAG TPA: four helix bundle protein [Verrucomicrobiales bacterium]|nr:four helix bundle protein [Verrucomicrobiales bacterium]
MGKPFENAEAWRSARTLAGQAYAPCQRAPLSKDFGLRDQLQRAAVSVMNNIAEGWESLRALEKRQTYNIARRPCGEARSMSYVLRFDSQFISREPQIDLPAACAQTGKLVPGLIRALGDRS